MIGYTRLGSDLNSVSQFDMPGDSYLTAYHSVVADFCRTGNSRLGRNNRVFSYFDVMCDLYQVVEFHTFFDNRRTHCSSVYCCIGSDLDVVFEYDVSYLSDFRIFPVGLGSESESVSSDNGSRMQNTIVADDTAVIDFYSCKNGNVIADNYIIPDIGLRIDFYVFTYFYSLSDIGERS